MIGPASSPLARRLQDGKDLIWLVPQCIPSAMPERVSQGQKGKQITEGTWCLGAYQVTRVYGRRSSKKNPRVNEECR